MADGKSMTARRDWVPVAQTWVRDPEDKEPWRRLASMPALALNVVEQELIGPAAGRTTCVLGAGDGTAPLALGAIGARVTVVDPSRSLLDMVMIRARIIGVELDFVQTDFCDLSAIHDTSFDFAYAAQATRQIEDLDRFYAEVHRILCPGGRFIVNEYHPVRRVWKQEPGNPQVECSYFDRRRPREEGDLFPDPNDPGASLGRFDFSWTVSDHFGALVAAGFRVTALEEVGDTRQKWEIPNLKGLPEQLVLAADRPAS
ncbi:MAG TPA: class I SAM-dependent methyltransferase [bacterium]|nr:class I SAM-dependent methyltransferase [bacterium]